MPDINKAHIEKKVRDWTERVNKLYSFVRNHLSNIKGIECKTSKNMTMYEEQMKKFDVPPANVPILDVYKENILIASFKPLGLWVIGANGRIDVLTKTGVYILVDLAENGRDAKWEVFTPTNKQKAQSFNANFVKKLARSLLVFLVNLKYNTTILMQNIQPLNLKH
jgi:hypothetical protein